jgi:hypothetical protein
MRIVAMLYTTNTIEALRFPHGSTVKDAVNHTRLHVSAMELFCDDPVVGPRARLAPRSGVS